MDPASAPQRLVEIAIATVPALSAALFATASAAVSSLGGARRAALAESLTGASRRALERYIAHESGIESRWLVLRVLGIAGGALLFVQVFPDRLGQWRLALAAMSAVVAYGVPAQVARMVVARMADAAAPRLIRLLYPLEILVWPLAAPIVWLGNLLGSMVTRQAPSPKVTETEVGIMVNEGEQAGALQHEQSEMIRNVLEFGNVTAGEVMLPRTQVTSFDVDTSIDEVLQVVAETEHSRYPVYRGTIENVFGVLHVKDLIRRVAKRELETLSLADLVRTPVAFVPESQTASSVLKDMRAGRHHMAIVIDEFGGMAGIVTLEDLIEEIVGDIRDEHDEEDPPIVDLGDGRLMVDASVSIADLSRYLGTELPENDAYNSLGGFVVTHFGRVPRVGAKLNAFGLEFVVREADDRHVAKVEIVRVPPTSESVLPPSSRSISAA